MPPGKIASCCQNVRAISHKGDPKYCNACKRVYCDICYDAQLVHQDDSNRENEHEKTDLNIANFVLSLFGTKGPAEERDRLHQSNLHSKWFGMVIDQQELESRSYFHDFGGFIRLLHESELLPHEQFPSLISFVGDTGAGKSTLINGILKLPSQITHHVPEEILSPVMGVNHEQHIPTSGDVHLFSDPTARSDRYPMFYADCEGIDGGEIPPVAAKCLGRLAKISDLKELVHKQREMCPPITRGWAVRELYPRILFPFSDVVCYVTKNPRRFEHHLETLLHWAHRAIDKTTNQPMLPHAFLIINAVKLDDIPKDAFQDWWDSDKVTSHFLTIRQDIVKPSSSGVGKLAIHWITRRGREIKSLEQLIKCYYRDFKIICIPEIKSSQHSHITAQCRNLQDAIRIASESSQRSRRDLGFLMSAEILGRYLEMAFDHFTVTPNKPFNFLSAALLHSPVTQTLGDHICKFAVRYMDIYPEKTGRMLFEELAPWVASCIFLSSHRLNLPQNDVPGTIFEQYQHFCQEAQMEFYDRNWPCEATNKRGNRCVNIKSTHAAKGHQDHTGKIFFSKDPGFKLAFKSSFNTYTDKKQANEAFSEKVHAGLTRCIRQYKKLTSTNEMNKDDMRKAVADIHVSVIDDFRKEGVLKGFVSHTTCFCCLTSSPAHKLRCGHIICQLCLEDYSNEEENNLFCRVVKMCPLCGPWEKDLKLEMKPPTAGLRILCLDGGGIRSIIQLEILKHLECTIGLGIPIRSFFDLIVGTSAGGIVAAGVGLKNLSTDDCIRMFTNFANRAFKRRIASDWPVLGKLVMAHHHGRYKTIELENVLKDVFGQDHIFGAEMGGHNGNVSSLKVAVTATSSNRQTFLLTNYNRPPPGAKNTKQATTEDDDKGQEDNIIDEVANSEAGGELYEETLENFEYQNHDPEYSKLRKERPKGVSEEISTETSERILKKSSEEDIRELFPETTDDNLNERVDTRSSYVFFRGENQGMELRLWEALRASSAAPGYFKPFSHPATKYTFDDGGLRCNNPVFVADKERKILWPDRSKQDPDILLSIGTGFVSSPPALETTPAPAPKPRGAGNYFKRMVKLGSDAILEDMNCEVIWQEFTESLRNDNDTMERSKRYRRLNLGLKTPMPRLDEVNQMDNLRSKVKESISLNPNVKEIANTLIGALFYFELRNVSNKVNPGRELGWDLTCKGAIKCRLGSKALAQRMNSYESPNGETKNSIFLIGERSGFRKGLVVNRGPGFDVTEKISYDVSFRLTDADKDKQICLFLSLWDDFAKAVSISGFPRLLFSEAKSLSIKSRPKTNSFPLPAC